MDEPEVHDSVPGTLEELRPWLREMRRELRENTRTTKRIDENTETIVAAFRAAQGFWTTLAWLGDSGMKIVKFFGACAVAGAAMWLAVKGMFDGGGK